MAGDTIDSAEESVVVDRCTASFGEPLVMASCLSGAYELAWDPIPDADDYGVYRGNLSVLRAGSHDHAVLSGPSGCGLPVPGYSLPAGCATDGEDHYYLVVLRRGPLEGTYGFDSLASARPAASSPCP